MEQWTYAILLAASISVPLIRSFEHRVAFYRNFPHLFKGILVMMLLFIPWDIYFTRMNVWSFNYSYVLGVYVQSLPLEEWLFFIVITYCCVFVYEVLIYFFPRFHFPRTTYTLTVILGLLTITIALLNTHRMYTFVVMYLSSILLFWQISSDNHKKWLSHFYLMFFISLIPFFIVNGILTSFPVVIYDDTQNLSLRLGTIPYEDMFYFMSMMFITIMVYENSRGFRKNLPTKRKGSR
jgi:lycopene cyclase domain-containing protein